MMRGMLIAGLLLSLLVGTAGAQQAQPVAKQGAPAAAKPRAAKPAKAAKAAARQKKQPAKQSFTTYRFRKNDNLGKVARSYGLPVSAIVAANQGLDPRRIRVGAAIRIPVAPKAAVARAERKPQRIVEEPAVTSAESGDAASPAAQAPAAEPQVSMARPASGGLTLGTMLDVDPTLTVGAASRQEGEAVSDAASDDEEDDVLAVGGDADAGDEGPVRADIPIPYTDQIKYSLTENDLLRLQSTAIDYLGTKYRYGGTQVGALDCSAFVRTVFRDVNISLPRTSREQFRLGAAIQRDNLKTGDLVFFARRRTISHVGIYIGDGMFIHAAGGGKGVTISMLDEAYYRRYYVGAKRIFQLQPVLADGAAPRAANGESQPATRQN